MQRVSNLNTLRIGIFGTWYSLWYDKEYYTYLMYKDYKLIEYLNSIYYRLRLPTTHFYLNRINQKYYYIQSNIHFIKPMFNKFTKYLKFTKKIFKYISLMEHLFDFNLLVPNFLTRDIKKIDYIMNNFKLLSKANKEISIYNVIYLNNYNLLSYYNFYFYNNINLFLLAINKKINLRYINTNKLSNLKGDDLFFKIIQLIENHKENTLNIDNKLINTFYNFININKSNKYSKSNNKYFIYEYNSYKINELQTYYNINLLIKKIFNIVKHNLYVLFKKNLFNIFLNNLNSYYLFFISKIYNKYLFFFNKFQIINNYYIIKEKNITLSFLNNRYLSLHNEYNKSYLNFNKNIDKLNKLRYKNKQYYLYYKYNKFLKYYLNNSYGFIPYYYLKGFNENFKFVQNNSIKIKNKFVDMVYFKKINKFNSFFKKIYFYFKSKYFNHFNFFIEQTIESYTGFKTFYLPTYYMKKFPIFDTKLLTDYVCYNMKRKHKITKIFNKISKLQHKANQYSKKLFIPFYYELNSFNKTKFSSFNNFNYLYQNLFFNKIFDSTLLSEKYNPVIGIRIECSGPPKKAQMAKTVAYHNVVNNFKLVGKMPTHSIYADIHFHQSYVKLRRSVFGIKVWLFYNSRLTNINNINKSIL